VQQAAAPGWPPPSGEHLPWRSIERGGLAGLTPGALTEPVPAARGTRRAPWGAAADAGAAIAGGAAKAGVQTAGFFSRLGKSIGRSF
jgi:hypothetical protein